MPRLVSSEINDYLEKTSSVKEKLNEALYDHYTECKFLSRTSSIKGEAGDSIKKYVEVAHISTIARSINVITNFEKAVKKLKELGEDCDKDSDAKIGSKTLSDTKEKVQKMKNEFIDVTSDSSSILNEASEFINTSSLKKEKVESDYGESKKKITKTNEKLDEMDKSGVESLSSITSDINGLLTQIKKLTNEIHDKNGIITSKINSITREKWYENQVDSGEFKKMKADSPVEYADGNSALQRVQGYSSDSHAVGTSQIGAVKGKAYSSKDGAGASGEALVGSLDGKVKSDYTEGAAQIEVASARGEAEITNKHIKANAEAQVIDARAQGEIGEDKNNVHGAAYGDVLSAKAGVNAGGDGVGAQAEAVGASAGIDGGLKISGVNVDVGASVGAQAGGAAQVGSHGIEVDAKFIFGGKVKITW
ncbi:hypothetical protein BUZ15_08790 [Staphylococcus gallinarum]|nr:T7SS effector LXG polymorphic toxin [Staphylococcus gallinarum]MCD8820508.1 LXG domain-containing protein [Staphylococcus gallinarum]PTK88481.1 hypothetical protein BUZ03_13285 [Staphylococcus gallinarum]PTL09540.1 hypothetical protein BUZ09_04990 [Staphylococcus gallinarum]PTL09877.1 hypothetical protein BUZ15_08790 [Staphylococcus gallinarum]RIL34044.1 hypothetical protein BUY98_05680 [Staphylococcus gallinarum]